jgi:hypothetical protein
VIGYDAGRRVMADPNDLHTMQRHVPLAGRLVLCLNDLPSFVRAAIGTSKMRALRLVTLLAHNRGDAA